MKINIKPPRGYENQFEGQVTDVAEHDGELFVYVAAIKFQGTGGLKNGQRILLRINKRDLEAMKIKTLDEPIRLSEAQK